MRRIILAWVAVAVLAYAAPSRAVDFYGYFRDSIGGNTKGGGQACFRTPGMDYKLRLGNECDTYGEWGFEQVVWKDQTGVEFKVGFMIDYDVDVMTSDGTALPTLNSGIGLQQNYVKAKFPQLGGAQFWGGRQYYRRENIDMIDFFYLNTSEPGFGIEDVDLGFGKVAVSVFATKPNTAGDFTRAFWRPDVRVYGIPVNPGGSLEADLNVVVYSKNKGAADLGRDDGKASVWVTVEHTQENLMGGSNKLALQWANGAAAQMGPGTPGFGADPLNKNNQQFRVVEQLLLQPSAKLQALIGGVFQWKRQYAGDTPATATKTKFTQWGIFGRPVYYLNDYFKLQGDLGFTQNKPEHGDALSLFKATFAPTLTPTPGKAGGFFVRPEIRAFVTVAAWNKAAAAMGSSAPGGGLFQTDKSGASYGLSVEAWFP